MCIEFISTAAEVLPTGTGCAKSKNKTHKRAVWAVCQGTIFLMSSQICQSVPIAYILNFIID